MTPRILAALTELRDALAAVGVSENTTIYAHANDIGEGPDGGSGVTCHGTAEHSWLTVTRTVVGGLELKVIHARPATEAEIAASLKPHERSCPHHWSRKPEIANAETAAGAAGRV